MGIVETYTCTILGSKVFVLVDLSLDIEKVGLADQDEVLVYSTFEKIEIIQSSNFQQYGICWPL